MLIDDDKDIENDEEGTSTEQEVDENEEKEVETSEKSEDSGKKASSDDKNDDDSDLIEYSESVKRRISKLTYKTREAERREAEALEYARAVKTELDEIRKRETSMSRSFEAEAEARLQSQEALVRNKLRIAVDTGDVDNQVEAQAELARLVSEQERLRNFKEYRKHQEQEEVAQQQVRQQRPVVQQPRPDPKAQDWAEKNKWFGADRVMTQAALTIHEDVVSEGYNPNSEDYYRELDSRIRREFPHKFAQKKPTSTVASGRPTQVKKSSNSIELSDTQKNIAKRLGISYDDYKRQLKLVQERVD